MSRTIFHMATLSSTSLCVLKFNHKLSHFHTAHSGTTRLPLTPHQLHRSDSPTLHTTTPLITIRHAKHSDVQGQEVVDEVIEEDFFDYGFGRKINNNDDDDDFEDVDENEGSIDLLLRFLQSIFKKVSRRVRKASRSILPPGISPQLVSFAVDGVLLLASLSIMKAFLEVVCSLGGTIFVAVLLLRVFWSGVSYFQSGRSDYNQSGNPFGTSQPV